jgi:predicted RNase H-like HicB family nuclease
MQIPVLIEPVSGNGYRASGGEPFAIVVEGATPEDALGRFKEGIAARLRDGARVTAVEVPAASHPLSEFAGIFSDADPIVQEWLEIIRQQRDVYDE